MAKRKAAGTRTRKIAGRKTGRTRGRKAARKPSRRGIRNPSTRAASARAKPRGKAARPSANTSKARRKAARKARPRRAMASARKAGRTQSSRAVQSKKVPALNRARRTVIDEDIVPTPPSSLDLDRRASAVRTGRREMQEKRDALTQTGPALTGGDIDADFESAYSVGDEVPGGDNPTPDQDIVDDIGKAIGVEYEDNEELKGDTKITKRDRHRWELDPASSEDYNDR